MALLGIEIGGTKLQAAVVSPAGEALASRHEALASGSGASEVLASVERLLAAVMASTPDRIDAVGVGFGGPVDRGRGRVAASYQVEGWGGFPLAAWVRDRLRLPVTLENDTNAATLAEAVHGAGRGCRSVVYTNSGSGIGAGWAIEGRIHHGRPPGEMELGHLLLSPEGPTVENSASGWSIDREICAAVEQHPGGSLAAAAAGQKPSALLLGPALAAGDPQAAAILDRAARAYALGLSHVVHLLNPDAIGLGGGVAKIGEPWRRAVEGHLGRFVMKAFCPPPPVRLSLIGDLVVPVGAALVAAGNTRAE
ncbi:MAG: ROK family protein [Planctomycetota bacterium]